MIPPTYWASNHSSGNIEVHAHLLPESNTWEHVKKSGDFNFKIAVLSYSFAIDQLVSFQLLWIYECPVGYQLVVMPHSYLRSSASRTLYERSFMENGFCRK